MGKNKKSLIAGIVCFVLFFSLPNCSVIYSALKGIVGLWHHHQKGLSLEKLLYQMRVPF